MRKKDLQIKNHSIHEEQSDSDSYSLYKKQLICQGFGGSFQVKGRRIVRYAGLWEFDIERPYNTTGTFNEVK